MSEAGVAARLVVLALLAAAPAYLSDFRTFLLSEILIFGLFAASLDLLIGYGGLPSLGHAAFYGAGAYATALLAVHVTANVFAELVVATCAAAVVACVIGILAVRTRGIYFLMLTLASAQLLYQLAFNWNSVTGGSNGLSAPRASLGATGSSFLVSHTHFYYYALIAFLVGYGFLRLVVGSPFGRALAGIRENEGRMRSLGYAVPLYKLASFCIAGAVAGYAGALTAQQTGFVSPNNLSLEVSVLALIAVIVGGSRTLLGPVVGAAFVYIVREELASAFSQHWRLVLGCVFVAVVYFLPYGLVGLGRRIRDGVRGQLRSPGEPAATGSAGS